MIIRQCTVFDLVGLKMSGYFFDLYIMFMPRKKAGLPLWVYLFDRDNINNPVLIRLPLRENG